MKLTASEAIECGEKTCASEPGKFCRFIGSRKFGQVAICTRFLAEDRKGTDFVTLDEFDGWVMRCDQCVHHFGTGEKEKDFNHTAIINTPIGGECVLIINGERQRWRVVKNFTDENKWCGELCPFHSLSDGCPGEDDGCSLASNYHKSGRDVMLKRVDSVEASDGNY